MAKNLRYIFDISQLAIQHLLFNLPHSTLFQSALFQLTVPPWPFYRLKPLKWQKARPDPTDGSDASKGKKKKWEIYESGREWWIAAECICFLFATWIQITVENQSLSSSSSPDSSIFCSLSSSSSSDDFSCVMFHASSVSEAGGRSSSRTSARSSPESRSSQWAGKKYRWD